VSKSKSGTLVRVCHVRKSSLLTASSDRFTADDLLGCVDVPIHSLMHDDASKNNISRREDKLVDDRGREAQGDLSIVWEVGYFEKTSVREHRSSDDVEHMRKKVDKKAEAMLTEAIDAIQIGEEQQEDAEDKDVLKAEVEQQKEEDIVHESNELIAGERPLHDYLSGILSIEIEQISGLEVQQTKSSGVKPEAEQEGAKDDQQDTDGLPSAYCTVIINDRKAYRTRTKMMDDNPYVSSPFIFQSGRKLTPSIVWSQDREVRSKLANHHRHHLCARQPVPRN
jgi:hypothetical protein